MAIAQDTTGYHGLMRVENEYKLHVPDTLADRLWNWLASEFGPDQCVLRMEDSTFRCQPALDRMVDQYFDDAHLNLLHSGNGVRLRSRQVLSDTLDRKHGRRLMQVKINHVDNNALNRGEFKFKLDSLLNDTSNSPLERHPFYGLVLPSHRDSLRGILLRHSIAGDSLRPTALIDQLRRRIYISRDTVPFATLSMDEVTGIMNERICSFHELELELNEKGYTGSDSIERTAMERVNEFIKAHIIKHWPAVFQDQRSKYTKVFAGTHPLACGTADAQRAHQTRMRWWMLMGIALAAVTIGLLARRRRMSGQRDP